MQHSYDTSNEEKFLRVSHAFGDALKAIAPHSAKVTKAYGKNYTIRSRLPLLACPNLVKAVLSNYLLNG